MGRVDRHPRTYRASRRPPRIRTTEKEGQGLHLDPAQGRERQEEEDIPDPVGEHGGQGRPGRYSPQVEVDQETSGQGEYSHRARETGSMEARGQRALSSEGRVAKERRDQVSVVGRRVNMVPFR